MRRLALIAGVAVAFLAACASAPETVDAPDAEREEALALQAEVNRNDLAQYAEDAAARAESALEEAETAYDAEDYETARTGHNEAIDN